VGQNDHDPEGKKSRTPKGGKKDQERRRKKSFQQKFGRKSTGRKYNFKPAPLLHFHSAADTESTVLALIGGILGWLVAFGAIQAFAALAPRDFRRSRDIFHHRSRQQIQGDR
jgi:hypothetical protein